MKMFTQTPEIRIGVSACLLGKPVRFDGGHKRDRFLTDKLQDTFKLVPFCPEVAVGMGTPRQPIRLVGDPQRPRAVGSRDPELDYTDDLENYGRCVGEQIHQLSGFVFKKDSPSCGMTRVKVYNDKGMAQRNGTGLFARQIMEANPLLPLEEEGRLNDAVLRDNFFTRVLVYARWQSMQAAGLSKSSLIAFHSSHKLLLLAHSTVTYRKLGRLLSDLGAQDLTAVAARYIQALMTSLSTPASRKRHTNVLQHLLGYLKRDLDSRSRADLAEVIDQYRLGLYPLIVPVRMLRHYFRVHPNEYVQQQAYLNPHPPGLVLNQPEGGL